MDEIRLGDSFAAVAPLAGSTAPAAPSALAASANSLSQITLVWTDNASDETGFKIERSPDGSAGCTQIATPAANATSYADTGLAEGTLYFYRVRAANEAGLRLMPIPPTPPR